MAGLAAAARARELGADVAVYEKGDRPGGSMLLSSCVVWRYREWETFRAECPGGDPALQRAVWEGLDDALAWLESLGAPVVARETGNPRTTGVRFDPLGLTRALAQGRPPRTSRCPRFPTASRRSSPRAASRATPSSSAATSRRSRSSSARIHGAPATACGWRWAAAPRSPRGWTSSTAATSRPRRSLEPEDFVRLAQVYARHAVVENARGERFTPAHWADLDVVQWTARQPGARAWYVVPDEALGEPVRERTVGEIVEAAREAGAPVERRDGATRVEVVAAITTTLGGIRVDERGRAADGLWAAGADAGGISTGGWSSALAAALVLGKTAAEDALR